MKFGLKNAGATYQRAMNFIFHEYIGTLVEIYIDDIVIKSEDITKYLADLQKILECTRKHGLKMNPNKCAFGVSAGQFLGFMVHHRGIEISRKSIDAMNKVVAPANKTELQSLIGKINFIRRFISNLSGKIKAFSPLLKLKADQKFGWGDEQQLALDEIKKYLTNAPVLVPPQHGKPFRLYLSTDGTVIGSALEIFGNSMLVINQLARIYECRSEVLISYYERCLQLLKGFRDFCLEHVSRLHNEEANRLAQHASGYQPIQEVLTSAVNTDDWRREIVDYLKNPSKKVERRIRFQATKYVLLDDELYYRTIDGVLLKCVSSDESKSLMGEIHEGVCGAHQSAFKMKWMIRRNGYYWPNILEDCFKYFKGCQGCQKFGNIQRAPALAMNPIIKPWPFRGWAIDLIGQIYPPSSKGHKFILVATDYFTKWVEAIPLKKVTSANMIDFVQEHIVYRFGIPQTITTDQGTMFTSGEFDEFAVSIGIKVLNSSPYYAQANGQAEASNKGIIKSLSAKLKKILKGGIQY
jgi:hypothetical protein